MKPVLENWTVVVVGKWNVGIFNPQWLIKNIFENDKLGFDFPLEPTLPLRITGDKVLLIPSEQRIILAPTILEDSVLQRVEDLTVQLLDKLPHTPVTKAGINFGYKVDPVPEKLSSQFKNPHADALADKELKTLSKSFIWNCDYKGQNINIYFDLKENVLFIKFNYHSAVESAEKAKNVIQGKIFQYREKTEEILEEIYDLKVLEES